MEKRKEDRRKALTKEAVKDAMLALLKRETFDHITVASLCREAGIGRATFYTHYTGLTDVIDELSEDAIKVTRKTQQGIFSALSVLAQKMRETTDLEKLEPFMELLPVCQRVADNPKYHVMFEDSFVSDYILMKIYHHEKPEIQAAMTKAYHLTPIQADKLFLFTVEGAFAVNKAMGWKKDEAWYAVQKVLLTFLEGGYDALAKL